MYSNNISRINDMKIVYFDLKHGDKSLSQYFDEVIWLNDEVYILLPTANDI